MFELSEKVSRLQPGTLWVSLGRITGINLRIKNSTIWLLEEEASFLVLSLPKVISSEIAIDLYEIHIMLKNKTGFFYFHRGSSLEINLPSYFSEVT